MATHNMHRLPFAGSRQDTLEMEFVYSMMRVSSDLVMDGTADLIIATDDDQAGNDYAARIAAHFRHRRIHRARPSKVATT